MSQPYQRRMRTDELLSALQLGGGFRSGWGGDACVFTSAVRLYPCFNWRRVVSLSRARSSLALHSYPSPSSLNTHVHLGGTAPRHPRPQDALSALRRGDVPETSRRRVSQRRRNTHAARSART
jgi:hypothetical protein